MVRKNVFSNINVLASCAQMKKRAGAAANVAMMVFIPLIIYICCFYFGMMLPELAKSPLLHFFGGIASFLINLCTLVITFCIGFITGYFEFMRESLRMFPFAQPQLRVVIGLIFLIGLIKHVRNTMVGGQIASGCVPTVFIPVASGIALFFGANWLNGYQDLQLSVAEQVYIGIGYPVFYYFQSGKKIKLKKRKKPNWR